MKRTRLIEARAHRNWTLEQVAELLGCSANTVDRWELGKVTPSAYYQAKLSELYGVPWEVLDLMVVSRTAQYNTVSPFEELETVDIMRSRREILQRTLDAACTALTLSPFIDRARENPCF